MQCPPMVHPIQMWRQGVMTCDSGSFSLECLPPLYKVLDLVRLFIAIRCAQLCHCSVMTLVHILVYVFDSMQPSAHLHIDMAIEQLCE